MKRLLFKIRKAAMLSPLLCILLVSCKNGAGTEPSETVLTWKDNLPALSERQTISQNEIYAWYEGRLGILMDGKNYGPYNEKVRADNTLLPGKIVFESTKTQYDGAMRNMTTRFRFDNIELSTQDGGKAIVFTGKDGKAYISMLGGEQYMGDNTSVAGAFYKQDGNVYITYTVTYNTDDMKKNIPLIPANSHNSLSGTMIKGIKK
ncbi:MAG: hypothetical protein ACFNKL_04480 [Treponema sp.]